MKVQRRSFYLGHMKGALGGCHPALDKIVPTSALSKGSWKTAWSKGPLNITTSEDDEEMCFKRYQRENQVEQLLRHTYEKSLNSSSRLHNNLERKRAQIKQSYSDIEEARYVVDESWDGRSRLDWEVMSDDTVQRIILSSIFSPETSVGEIGTTDSPEQFLEKSFSNCKSSGKIALAKQRNLELWTEATTHAVIFKQEDLLKTLPETLVQSCRDVADSINKTRTDKDQEPSKHILPHRHCLTNQFLFPPLQKVDFPGKDDLSKLDVKAHISLIRWYQNMKQDSNTRKEWFVNTSRDQLSVRKLLTSKLTLRTGVKRDMDNDIAEQEKAIAAIQQSEEKWRRVLNKKRTPLHAEEAHLLKSLPTPVVPKFALEEESVEMKSDLQEHLADLLSTTKYKKCLLVDNTGSFRAAVYDLAWMLSRERLHYVRSEQRKTANHLTQRARRRVEISCKDLMDRHRELFTIEHSTPDRTDYLFAPDQYAADIDSMFIY